MDDTSRATLVRPPPLNPQQSAIENVLELTQLSPIGPDIFTNTRPLWHPPGARGIYGGAVIAQCLAAAQRTVPPHFTVHSMHCYFVLAGDSTIPILYHVEHVREGRSFATRTVQARQKGRCIFTTTMSFAREGSGGPVSLHHGSPMPKGVQAPEGAGAADDEGSPFESRRLDIHDEDGGAHAKKTRQWIRAKGKISPAGGHEAHLSALAYMSDSYFIGTVPRAHKLPSDDSEKGARMIDDGSSMPSVGMMVSLDHTIYFHEPRSLKADEWLFTEMQSPWSGDGRGLVVQRMWSADGKLIATCVQEGVVRLKQESKSKL